MRSLAWALTLYDWGPYKKGEIGTQRQAQKENYVKVKAKIGVMHLQSKKMPKIASKPLGAGGQAWSSFSLKALVKEPTLPGDTLILDF